MQQIKSEQNSIYSYTVHEMGVTEHYIAIPIAFGNRLFPVLGL